MNTSVKVAIVQQNPIHFNKKECLTKAISIIEEAALQKSQLIVFGETWFCGYPSWIDYCSEIGLWNHKPMKEVFTLFHENAITVSGTEIKTISTLAAKLQIVICLGFNEKVLEGEGNGTIYNSVIIINSNGQIVNHRRKLMPTFTEKLLYGLGNGANLHAADTTVGRIGSMICWEHWMPLTRQAMHNSGEQIHIALWPQVHEMLQLSSRHYAFEGRCFVIAVGQIFKVSDIPKQLITPDELKNTPEKLLLNGNSCVFGPDGTVLLEPQTNINKTIYFTIENINSVYGERMALDVSGHYNRPDVFDFKLKI